jgi:ABC-type nitrate/sulfonate/bicarbonate transport system ATPase subunit
MVFQEDGLLPWLTVIENAAFGLEAKGWDRKRRESAALGMLREVGLDGREGAYPYQLSTGMKQRVALARSFLSRPAVMLMDEPFAALDALTRLRLQRQLIDLWQQIRCTVVLVTHDVEEAILLSDRIVVLSEQPARVLSEAKVGLPHPRRSAVRDDPQFLTLRRELLGQLGIGLED